MSSKSAQARLAAEYKNEIERIQESAKYRTRAKKKAAQKAANKERKRAIKTGVPEHLNVFLVTNFCGTPIYTRKFRSGSPMESKIVQALTDKRVFFIREVMLGSTKLFYDFYLPTLNMVIEYNGKAFHSSEEARKRDTDKQRHAMAKGFRYVALNSKNINEFLSSL